MCSDLDEFNRWDASQRLASLYINKQASAIRRGDNFSLDETYLQQFKTLLNDKTLDQSYLAELLSLPSENALAGQQEQIDIDGNHLGREHILSAISVYLRDDFLSRYKQLMQQGAYTNDHQAIARRTLKNHCLAYLMQKPTEEIIQLCTQQFYQANNMTDKIAALKALSHIDCEERLAALDNFYQQWKSDHLVLDKWFIIQASSKLANTLAHINQVMQLEQFTLKNPNRVRALIGTFCNQNSYLFHAVNGEAYEFLVDQIKIINEFNPQCASRLCIPLTKWRRLDQQRQEIIEQQLINLINHPNLSTDVYEIISKSLA